MNRKIFVNRRNKNTDRRKASDPCRGLAVDLYNRKRRKSPERREERSLEQDYYAFMEDSDKIKVKPNTPSADNNLH